MTKLVADYFTITEKRDYPRRFWNKDKTRYYNCVQCAWETSSHTKTYSATGAMLTSLKVSFQLASHLDTHKKKKGKK